MRHVAVPLAEAGRYPLPGSTCASDADEEGRAIGIASLFDLGQRVGTALLEKDEVIGVHGIALLLALAVGRMRRVDAFANGIGEIELAGDAVLDRKSVV